MRYGAAYYPDAWPEECWAAEAARMRAAHMNVTRLAEFGAAQTGNLVADALEESGRAVAWLAHRAVTAPRGAGDVGTAQRT